MPRVIPPIQDQTFVNVYFLFFFGLICQAESSTRIEDMSDYGAVFFLIFFSCIEKYLVVVCVVIVLEKIPELMKI